MIFLFIYCSILDDDKFNISFPVEKLQRLDEMIDMTFGYNIHEKT